MIMKMTLYKAGSYSPFQTGPGTHRLMPTSQGLVSVQLWCLKPLVCRQHVSSFTTVYTEDQPNLSIGTKRVPLALSYGRKKCTKKTPIDSLDKCRREWVWLMSTACRSYISLGPSNQWAIKLTAEPSIYIFSFHTPLLPGGLKFPSWSSTDLFSSSLQYFYFTVAKKTSLTDSPCQNASYVTPGSVQCADALGQGRQGGKMGGSDKDTKEMTEPLRLGASQPLGLALTTQQGCRGQWYTWTWQSKEDKVLNTLNPA